MADQLRFDDKVVIVTGAGNGLGRSHALMFGARGAKVVVNDLGGGRHGDGSKSSAAADKVVEEIKALGGQAAANYDSVEDGDKIVQTAMDAFGTVDVVINNAGILRDVSFHKMTVEDWNLIYRVHLNGSFRVTHAAWPIMREKGYGRIIMTTSAAGIYGNFGQANYSAAKLALVGLASTLSLEGAAKNVLVNTIAPLAASRLTETVLPPELLEKLNPAYVSPLVGWLCHQDSRETGGLFEVGAGMVNKLRWERTVGHGYSVKSELQIEDVASKWDEICDFSKTTHPANIAESMAGAMDNINNPKLGGNKWIDLDEAKAAKPIVAENSYDQRDLSLYALGVGVGADPLAPQELQYVYELGENYHAVPTYGVMPALNAFMKLQVDGGKLPGLSSDLLDRVLHGEQYTEIKRPLPPQAKLRHEIKLRTAYDKGKDAVGIIDVHTFDESGEELAYNEITTFLRGCGGWGGDRGPSADVNVPPAREPDAVIEEKIGESQALLYRLSGDWNPLHIDPEFAKNFGFDRPILHGLCTFGYVGRHIIKQFLGNDPRRFKSIKVRFAKSVYPGDTLVTRMWKESDLRIVFETRVKERDEVVIKNAAVELYETIPLAKAKVKAVAAASTATSAQPAGPIPEDIFKGIGKAIAQAPGMVGKIATTFAFKLSAPDSSWVIDLKNAPGAARAGDIDKPDVTLSLSQADFIDMCTGKADPQKLFMGGKLKIGGNLMASQKLEFLKTMDPKLVMDAVAERVGAGGGASAASAAAAPQQSQELIAADIFNGIAKALAAQPAMVAKAATVFQFVLKDPDSAWTLDLKNAPGSVKPGSVDKPDVTLTLSDADFLDMCTGKADPQKLFMGGKLKIGGNLMASQKLEFLKTMDRKLVEQAQAERLGSGAPAASASSVASSKPAAAEAPAKSGRAAEIFAALSKKFGSDAKSINGAAGAVMVFEVSEPKQSFVLDLSGPQPKIESGKSANAAAVFGIADEDLVALVKGEAELRDLYQRGRLRVDGDIRLAHQLGFLQKLI